MKDSDYQNYSDDWNLIMTVVEKINEIDLKTDLPKESDGWYAYYSLEVGLSSADKEWVIRDIVKFIKWYNEK